MARPNFFNGFVDNLDYTLAQLGRPQAVVFLGAIAVARPKQE
jgi:hypothetical protein